MMNASTVINKPLVIATALIISFPATAFGEELNKTAYIKALVQSEREPRSWKTLKLWPGKVRTYYYEWVMPDGSIATKTESYDRFRKDVPDMRILRDRHPNGAIALIALNLGTTFFGSFAGNLIRR